MATTTQLPHPNHEHPLMLVYINSESVLPNCDLCWREASTEAYTCLEGCEYFCHRLCAEAPPRIHDHPLHPAHSLALIHHPPKFSCSACDRLLDGSSAFRCDDCDFILDLSCALATLLDRGGSPEGTAPEQIVHPLHAHRLTSFSTRNDFVVGDICNLCKGSVERDGHTCLRPRCDFIIHKRCVQDLYYADGTKAPRIYHLHQLEILVREENTGSIKCASCGSRKSGEFIGCSSCHIYLHRKCIQGPEVLQYSPHQHNFLVLFLPMSFYFQCSSCLSSTAGGLCYSCPCCIPFWVHVGCALQTLAYCEEGMKVSIECFWHNHPLFLCHGTESGSSVCGYCGDQSIGPTYVCQVGCGIRVHERCIKFESTISHYLHPDHPLTFATTTEAFSPRCIICQKCIVRSEFSFSCDICEFYLHSRCAIRPTLKHCLHEHKLLHFDEVPTVKCNRCSTRTKTPLFRCMQCNFNIHEKCAELSAVVKSDIHWHPLTLHETYIEDDSGEYYCDHCEKMRDVRLGAYVCRQCSARWAYHIECVLPELQILFGYKSKTLDVEALSEQINRQNERVREVEVELDKEKLVLDELKKKLEKLISGEEENYVAT